MNPAQVNKLSRHAGFSLVELMVAVVIGLIGTLVMFQVFACRKVRSAQPPAVAMAMASSKVVQLVQINKGGDKSIVVDGLWFTSAARGRRSGWREIIE